MTVTGAIKKRRSVHSYDPGKKVTMDQLKQLISLSALAPSSFNLNQWRFIIVQNEASKKRLHAVSLGQKHILDAAATLIVLGKIDAHEDVSQFTEDWIDKGYYPDDSHLKFVSEKFYGMNPEIQRDEAIRSTSIMVGIMMLAAVEMGLSTAAIIGFKPEELIKEFNIPENYVPVMLLTVGYELNPMPERLKRLDFNAITYKETFGDKF